MIYVHFKGIWNAKKSLTVKQGNVYVTGIWSTLKAATDIFPCLSQKQEAQALKGRNIVKRERKPETRHGKWKEERPMGAKKKEEEEEKEHVLEACTHMINLLVILRINFIIFCFSKCLGRRSEESSLPNKLALSQVVTSLQKGIYDAPQPLLVST